ncbi:uncharacterized protein LOC129626895 [Bubalus kerabau]|uniref:uncharacterized protein LOC129626895 n=1 Tax=Bubalus carabanensis TaxID=3119969 RepID=UPI00244EC75A|nr:uncharacterized protein LOC129626895 [Bubalus carabanensis]
MRKNSAGSRFLCAPGSAKRFVLHKEKMASPIVFRPFSSGSGARNPFSGREDAAGSGPHLAASAAGAARSATAPPPRLRAQLKPGDSLGTEIEARRLRGALWGLRARPAPGGFRSHSRALRRPWCRGGRESSLPRTPELEWAFPSCGPRRRGRREMSRCARRLRPRCADGSARRGQLPSPLSLSCSPSLGPAPAPPASGLWPQSEDCASAALSYSEPYPSGGPRPEVRAPGRWESLSKQPFLCSKTVAGPDGPPSSLGTRQVRLS